MMTGEYLSSVGLPDDVVVNDDNVTVTDETLERRILRILNRSERNGKPP